MSKAVMIVEDNELNMKPSRPVGSYAILPRHARRFKLPDLARKNTVLI